MASFDDDDWGAMPNPDKETTPYEYKPAWKEVWPELSSTPVPQALQYDPAKFYKKHTHIADTDSETDDERNFRNKRNVPPANGGVLSAKKAPSSRLTACKNNNPNLDRLPLRVPYVGELVDPKIQGINWSDKKSFKTKREEDMEKTVAPKDPFGDVDFQYDKNKFRPRYDRNSRMSTTAFIPPLPTEKDMKKAVIARRAEAALQGEPMPPEEDQADNEQQAIDDEGNDFRQGEGGMK